MKNNLIKTVFNVPHLSESIAEQIMFYCLGLMSKDELNYSKWQIGTSSVFEEFENMQSHFWECQSEIEAIETKKYFIQDKSMNDADEKINGKFIYVRRL